MDDKGIIKALKCFSENKDFTLDYCRGCLFDGEPLCCENASEGIAKAALNLINRQQMKIDRLRTKVKEQDEIIENKPFAKFYMYKHSIENIEGFADDMYKKGVAEFVARLKESVIYHVNEIGDFVPYVEVSEIDNLKKKWVGDDNE